MSLQLLPTWAMSVLKASFAHSAAEPPWIRPLGEIPERKLSWAPLSCALGTQHFALAGAVLQACQAHPYPWPGRSELA